MTKSSIGCGAAELVGEDTFRFRSRKGVGAAGVAGVAAAPAGAGSGGGAAAIDDGELATSAAEKAAVAPGAEAIVMHGPGGMPAAENVAGRGGGKGMTVGAAAAIAGEGAGEVNVGDGRRVSGLEGAEPLCGVARSVVTAGLRGEPGVGTTAIAGLPGAAVAFAAVFAALRFGAMAEHQQDECEQARAGDVSTECIRSSVDRCPKQVTS